MIDKLKAYFQGGPDNEYSRKAGPAVAVMTIFLLLVFGFTIWDMVNPEQTFSENENRVLATFPTATVKTVFNGEFESGFETWLNDQFAERDSWVGLKTRTELAVGKKDVNSVYFGQDGYLMEKPAALDQTRLKDNQGFLSRFANAAVSQLGQEHVRVLMAPASGEVLSEKLPLFAEPFDSTQVTKGLDLPDGVLLDVTTPLKAHADESVYYRTDHHWTTLGAYYAYEAWAESCGLKPWALDDFEHKTVSQTFLGTLYSKVNILTQPDEIQEFSPKVAQQYQVEYNLGEKTSDSLYDADKLATKDQYAVFLGGNNPVVKITNPQVQNGRKLLVVKDSYAHSFAPFAANHFEEVTLVDLRYFNMGVQPFMEQIGATDVMVLYSASGFSSDRYIYGFVKGLNETNS